MTFNHPVAKQAYQLAITLECDHPTCTHKSCRNIYEHFSVRGTSRPCFGRTKDLLNEFWSSGASSPSGSFAAATHPPTPSTWTTSSQLFAWHSLNKIACIFIYITSSAYIVQYKGWMGLSSNVCLHMYYPYTQAHGKSTTSRNTMSEQASKTLAVEQL